MVLDAALNTALAMLSKNGEFCPFGITVALDGDVTLNAGDPDRGEYPPSTAILELLYSGLADSRGGRRAAGFVADVTADGSDAVRVEMEHRDGGPALVVVMPYQRTGFGEGSVTYGQMSLSPGTHRLWPST